MIFMGISDKRRQYRGAQFVPSGWKKLHRGFNWHLQRELLCCAAVVIGIAHEGGSMDEVVDRIIHTFGMMRNLDEANLREARESVGSYIDTLSSAGETDPKRLAVFGLAYLRNRQDGSTPGFTGC
jgi:hypothetical protein